MAPSRTGPQGTTMEDLRRVTGNITRIQPARPRMLPTADIVSNLVGGPLPTYGKKYGGYPTAEQFQQAIVGSLDPFVFARELASAQAAQNRADLAAQTRFQPRTPQDYDRLRAEQEALSSLLGQRIQPQGVQPDASLGRAADLAETQSRLADLYMQPDYQNVRRGRMDAQEAIRLLRREVPEELQGMNADVARDLAMRKATEDARADAYARNMERMNAIAFRQPGEETFGQTGGRSVSLSEVAAQRLGTPVTGAQAGEQTQFVREAQDLGRMNVSDLARQIAEQRYGVDPALASGMFGPEFAREFGIRQLGEAGVFPDQSIEEYIGLNQGPEALATFQQNQLQAALDKQNEGFRTADEEAYDLQLEQQTGLNVDAVAGNYSRAVARGYLENQGFVQRINEEVSNLVANPALNMEQQRNQARIAAQQYLTDTGDPVGAQILLNALLSFDFTLAFSAG